MEGFEAEIRTPPDMGRFPVPQKIERIPCAGGWLHPPVFFFFFPGMRVTTSPYEISLLGLSFQRFPGREYFFDFFGGF